MFLKELSNNQKTVFWKLANKLVRADGSIDDSEVKMLEDFKTELSMDDLTIRDYQEDIETILREANYTDTQKRILMLELFGLAITDKCYDQSEKDMLIKIQTTIGIADEEMKIIEKYVDEVLDLYSRIGSFININ